MSSKIIKRTSVFHNTTSDLQDQDQDQSMHDRDKDKTIFLVSDRSCPKTDVSDHITVICACRLFFKAALLPRRGPHIASHYVCLSV